MATANRKVGIPVDGSENSKRALQWYLDNVALEGDTVIFIRVREPPDLPLLNFKSGLSIPTEQWMEIIIERNRQEDDIETEISSICRSRKVNFDYVFVSHRKPGEGIIAKTEELEIQMIVMGSRGLDKIRRTFLGSVSDYVLHHTQVPVVIVPSDHTPRID